MCVLHRCDEHTNLGYGQLRLITIAVARSRGKEIILDSDSERRTCRLFSRLCARVFSVKLKKQKQNL